MAHNRIYRQVNKSQGREGGKEKKKDRTILPGKSDLSHAVFQLQFGWGATAISLLCSAPDLLY